MNLGDCTVTIGNQTFRATNVRIDHNGSFATASVEAAMLDPIEVAKTETILEGQFFTKKHADSIMQKDELSDFKKEYMGDWNYDGDSGQQVVTLNPRNIGKTLEYHFGKGFVDVSDKYKEEEKDMCREETNCADEYMSGNDLARKMVNLELTDEQRLLRRHEIVNLDGTLTQKGKDFLLNVLFEQAEDEVVEALTAIEIAEAEERN